MIGLEQLVEMFGIDREAGYTNLIRNVGIV
jgi:hypothetical protein